MRRPMFRLLLAALPAVLAGFANRGSLAGEGPVADEVRRKVDSAVAKVYPALVQIHVVTIEYYDGREQKYEAAGSGAIISAQGHVITNHHVAGKARRIRCTLASKEVIEASLVGTDPLGDIAIVKMDLSARKDKAPLPVAEFGDSDKLRVGDHVLAMGSPVALSQSVTKGIVSNTEMTIPGLFWPFTFRLDGEEVGTLVKWIGHDAAIYGGNSGGPLVDLDGRIVGINEISLGLGGAIPGNLARDIAKQIVEGGAVKRSWIGVQCQPLLEGSGIEKGALVAEVAAGSPGDAAGIKVGDVITGFDGKPVTVRFTVQIPEFNRLVVSTPVGATVPVEVLRGGQKLALQVTTALREPARGEERELKNWGITARQLTTFSARELKRPDKSGAFVWSIRPGGPASEAKPAIAGEDVIVSVAGAAIKDLRHLQDVTAEIIKGKDEPVPTVVAFDRGNERLLTVVKIGIEPEKEKPDEVKKAWLPASYQVLTSDLSEALKIKGSTGVRITQVYPKSTAEEAGLKVGDIVTHLDGEKIEASQPEDLEVFAQMIRQYKIGTAAEMTVLRGPDLQKVKIQVKLIERPVPEGRVKHCKDLNFEFEARDVTYMDRVRENWDQAQGGARVMAVQPGGWAALAHMAVGDLILAIDGEAVADVAALETRLKAIAEKRPKDVAFQVRRGIHSMFIEIQPAWPAK